MRFEDIEKNALARVKRFDREQRRAKREAKKAQAAQVEQTQKQLSRMYASARQSRLTSDWTTASTSADAELRTSLTLLRARCRALDRDSAYSKRAKQIVLNNVIGTGVGMQPGVRSARKKLMPRVNAAITESWLNWWTRPEYMHTGGELCEGEFERTLVGEVFEAGEVFVRHHFRSFGGSPVPYALELIESERVPHKIIANPGANSNERLGVEIDAFHRPIAYWIRDAHPSDFQYPSGSRGVEKVTRVDANEITHLRLITRWPQVRGVPFLHAVAKRLNDLDGYSEAEIVAARGSANYMASIETDPLGEVGDEQEDGSREVELAPGIIVKLNQGEKMNFFSPNRPNTALDPFMRYMLRETAAGSGVSYESLSRDYSQSNYSSSRLSLLEDRDNWRVLQMWYIRTFRNVVHRRWLQQAVLSRQIEAVPIAEYASNLLKFEKVKFKPRGWSWVDPTKEVTAARDAEKAGYVTKTQIIAETAGGQTLEDVLDEREAELELIEEKGLKFDTDSPSSEPAKPPPPTDPDPDDDDDQDDDEDDDPTATGRQMRLVE